MGGHYFKKYIWEVHNLDVGGGRWGKKKWEVGIFNPMSWVPKVDVGEAGMGFDKLQRASLN